MKSNLNFILIISIILLLVNIVKCELIEMYRWKQYAYDLLDNYVEDPTEEFLNEQKIAQDAEYIAYSNVPLGVAHSKDKIFIVTPRFNPGIPGTISYFNASSAKGSSPLLRPYPSYKVNQIHPEKLSDENRIVSVYRIRVDTCNRLWFVDTGMLEYPNNPIIIQRPSLWIMDLDTDKLIRRYEIPESIAKMGNGFISINVDVESTDCDNAYAYLPNMKLETLNVYSFKDNNMWSFRHDSFKVVPQLANFNVNGIEFSWKDGVFSVAIGKKNDDGYKTVYYHPMSAISEYTVSTKILQNESNSQRVSSDKDFKLLGQRGENSQSPMHDIDNESGVIFYGHVTLNGVSCWNSNKKFSAINHILFAQNNETMVYTADLQIDLEGTLWFLTNNMPMFSYGKLDTNEYNFRIWSQTAKEAVKGTLCEIENYNHNKPWDGHHYHHHHDYHHHDHNDC